MKGFARGLCFVFTATLAALFPMDVPGWVCGIIGGFISFCAIVGWED